MHHRPTVLLLHVRDARPHAPQFQQQLTTLNDATVAAVEALGGTAELVAAADVAESTVRERARRADAVVVLGGEDVDPAFYDGPRDYPGSGFHEPVADRVSIAVIRDAVQHGIPLLGICRGLQLMNVALGGTLVPDMHGHRSLDGDPFVQTRVTVEREGAAGSVAGAGPVLCTHHQAIDQVAPGLSVLVRAVDGVVEAVAHDTAPMLGVQWHPEHPDTALTQVGMLLRDVMSRGSAAR
ncbi:gamma-glutamyl-gamma-aminobutyrate hydrolase family protein [Microbacterium sp. zg.Y1090]|uniref:gamma-glutamyl-gamma-aminobutyrate hydrolase family protein n=1 Tax=Microbacterium TaxID=33882 RepID=UPI00214B7D7F|nr:MULTISPECIES: gamma-glutamyl-gamma-aminobutyrate hydrolase family protein [unclassified Microbacterium]MCR2811763.1 gamma-glutamyl-gamma-aminobutyrate hydrolase family protein [Microbacterium sp. zg.Y1084]MCR2818799.1 gamma-glutamyl-gamma-aminobutyrate hydrolase family protein [Microbacterium sp. zg.Y1090]MDL5486889.1 gamma-glutamyl-gamma-aminobutyrate hydrolase family protein [Microbacterium sp. zg-Y1211]WIM27113.1 gamma-glutamyl-gamma-aminobutyrate hydrolase family protein [Microbacterium 